MKNDKALLLLLVLTLSMSIPALAVAEEDDEDEDEERFGFGEREQEREREHEGGLGSPYSGTVLYVTIGAIVAAFGYTGYRIYRSKTVKKPQ